MAGLVDARSFGQFADQLRRGSLTPTTAVTAGPAPPASGLTLSAELQRVVKQILVSDVKSRFATGTDPAGAKWRPLGRPRATGGTVPLRDTGVLMASITGRSDARGVSVVTTHPGASLHNFGGVVRGKGKMLAIPLTREAKRAGSPRRFKGGLAFRPTKKARVFLLVGGKGDVGQFLLVDSVKVPRREFMGVSDRALAQVADAVLAGQARGWVTGR